MNGSDLIPILRAAAVQRHLLIPRHRDQRREEEGHGRVLHAVDTDVINLFSRPWVVSVTTDRRPGYAEVFPGGDKAIDIAIGQALAEFIFHRLNGDLPLLVIPPLDEEFDGVLRAVARKAGEEGEQADQHLSAMRELLKRAESMDGDEAAIAQLTEHATTIARFLNGNAGAVRELRRFHHLLHNKRIASLDYLLDHNLIASAPVCAALDAPTALRDRVWILERRERWFDRLHAAKSHATSSVRTDRDAYALARLEWINARLDATETTRADFTRLVLITGDEAMHAVATEYTPEGAESSFAELYLRHPRAYLAEPGVLSLPQSGTTGAVAKEPDGSIGDWLDTLLDGIGLRPKSPDYAQQIKGLMAEGDIALEERMRPLAERLPDLHAEFESGWTAYTRSLVIDHTPSEPELVLAGKDRRTLLERYRELIERLQADLDATLLDHWNGCFEVVAEGSYLLRRSRPPQSPEPPARNAPKLYFDHFTPAREFVADVLKSYQAGGINSQAWQDGLDGLKKKDPSGYLFFLALGVLFAAEGSWWVAAVLAQRALVIAERDKPKGIYGREAAYLRAVALRHSARRSRDLEPIVSLLERAEASYEQARVDTQANEDRLLRAAPCRFHSERLALYLSYHLFNLLTDRPRGAIPEYIPSLPETRRLIDDALADLVESEEDEEVIRYVQRNLLVNWLMAALLGVWFENAPLNQDEFSERSRALDTIVDQGGEQLPASYYVEAIRRVAHWISTPRETKHRAKLDALEHLNADKAAANYVMLYDKRRFNALRDAVEHGLHPLTSQDPGA